MRTIHRCGKMNSLFRNSDVKGQHVAGEMTDLAQMIFQKWVSGELKCSAQKAANLRVQVAFCWLTLLILRSRLLRTGCL